MSNFKLIDFLENPEFNFLRFSMNAPLIASFAQNKITLMDEDSVRRLGKEGIDIDFSEVKVEHDGTLSFKGKRVIVYIRDINEVTKHQSLPKYHLTFCRTLDSMTQTKRFGRYVIANREDGIFIVNYVGQSDKTGIEKRLSICQNCLTRLGWENFSSGMSPALKKEKVKNFTLIDFFKVYPKDLISNLPTYTSETAPLNDYSEDWGLISEKTKKERGYKCESCKLELNGPDKKFLHVHHIDGQKNNNSSNNLEILCTGCHAEEPMHSHMKNLRSYNEFMQKFKLRKNSP